MRGWGGGSVPRSGVKKGSICYSIVGVSQVGTSSAKWGVLSMEFQSNLRQSLYWYLA
jgi:hypothetical protein